MKKLIIIGASGFGREVAWLVERINDSVPTWELLGFVDDNAAIHNSMIGGYPVLGDMACLVDYPEAWVVCAIGASDVRKRVIAKADKLGVKYATLIDPSVLISQRVKIGEGTIICAQTIITVDIEIGRHVIINLDCTIGHDAILEDYVTLYPSVNVSGNTLLETCVEMGTGTQIIQGKKVGRRTIVGAGSVIIRDIPELCVAVGSPAMPKKMREE